MPPFVSLFSDYKEFVSLTLGYRFPIPVMQPVPPTDKAGTSQSLCPASAENWLGLKRAATLVTFAIPPHVSFTPAIFRCWPRTSSISELTSSPDTTPGKL